MKQAFLEAQKAFDEDEVPVGAVIVCKNQIIARGHNLTEKLTDVTAHAEIQAITAASQYLGAKYLKECTLYVTLEPCMMCCGAIMHARIARVVYGAADAKTGCVHSVLNLFDNPQLNHHTMVEGGVLAEECAQVLKDFFKERRAQA